MGTTGRYATSILASPAMGHPRRGVDRGVNAPLSETPRSIPLQAKTTNSGGGRVDYDVIEGLRQDSAAWRLLRADHAALVVFFLGRVFVDENVRSVLFAALAERLDETLYGLNEQLGEGAFPRSAKAYLDDWSAPSAGWLRKYYPPGSADAHLDATPALERAVGWVRSLPQRSFVGTESRLNSAFDLLRQIAFGGETDRDIRLEELYRRRADLDEEISALNQGLVEIMDATAIRDRYQQFVMTSTGLLSDFREVEDNFRVLDRRLRERVATWAGSKGDLLDDVLGDRGAIAESDQGRSFHAFYDFLLIRSRQEEFANLLARVHALDAIEEVDPRIRRVHYDWLDAGERTQATVRLLSEQLRRFLDDRAWLENRRVMDVLRSIESHSLALRDHFSLAPGFDIDATSPSIALPFERPLYAPRPALALDTSPATASDAELDVSVLFEQIYVDHERLVSEVCRALSQRSQVALTEVLEAAPLERGLAELVGYFSLTDPAFQTIMDGDVRDTVCWTDEEGRVRVAQVPRLTYLRGQTPELQTR